MENMHEPKYRIGQKVCVVGENGLIQSINPEFMTGSDGKAVDMSQFKGIVYVIKFAEGGICAYEEFQIVPLE